MRPLYRDQLVHTPYGWGVVERPCHLIDARGFVVPGVMVTLESAEGDEPWPIWFRLDECELAVEVDD